MDKLQTIQKGRNLFLLNDNSELQAKRMKFLERLTIWNYNPSVEVYEMYPFESENGIIKNQPTIPQYFHEISFCNTRKKLPTETDCETDKLEFNKAVSLITETCLSLIRSKIHFALFYAEGQRSPHIRIYDIEGLNELTNFQGIKAQIKFWKQHIPFGCFQFVDTSLFDREHLLQLEFAPHWKYGTPFNLIFEWIPKEELCNSF
jgi:hypothetical protein